MKRNELKLSRILYKPVYPSRYNPLIPNDKYYYSVHVYDTKESMWAAARHLSKQEKNHKNDFGAITMPYQRFWLDDGRRAPKIGNILFYKDCLSAECVSHESTHAGIAYARMFNFLELETMDKEEKVVFSVSSILCQIVNEFSKANFYS